VIAEKVFSTNGGLAMKVGREKQEGKEKRGKVLRNQKGFCSSMILGENTVSRLLRNSGNTGREAKRARRKEDRGGGKKET